MEPLSGGLGRLERTLPLALKIAVPLVAISVAAATLLGFTMIVATRASFAATYTAQAEALAQLVGTGYAKDPLDRTAINTLLTDVWASEPSVRRIRIYRVDAGAAVLWASTDATEIGRSAPGRDEVAPITTGVRVQRELTDGGERVLETIEPVRVGARRIVASVAVFTSLRQRDAAVAAVARKIVLFGVVGVACQLAALWTILFWLVLRRTARLSRSAGQVAAGDLTVRLPEGREGSGDDELFNVAREFDHMLRAVAARTDQQAAVTKLGQRALEGIEPLALMDEAARLVAQNLGVDYVAMARLNPESDDFQLVAGVGWKGGVVGRVVTAEGLGLGSHETLAASQPVILKDLRADARFNGAPVLRDHQVASSVTVVIPGEDRLYGVLGAHTRDLRRFTEDDVHFLQAIANTLGWAIRHKAATEKLAHQALHDALTGLPNRVLFEDRLQQALAQADRDGDLVGLLFADLDNFKRLNDTLGHHVGDVLLKYVAQRLQGRIGPGDTLARMGGDEFAVVLTGLRHRSDAEELAQKLLASMNAPFRLEGYQVFLSGSIGISLYPQDGRDAAILRRNADTAMYRAKSRGTNSLAFFTPDMYAEVLERLELDHSLRQAIDAGEFSLHYQPQFDVRSRKLVGAEALLRWFHPKVGLILPAKFISMAEESGMIVPIGTWVLQEACRQNAAWQRSGCAPLRVAVNVSALQFVRADFVPLVAQALKDSGLEPRWLELELTESAVMRNVDDVRVRLAELRRLGVGIAIDDFGTGYSSLAYLQRLPIDSLKIDHTFVRDLQGSTAPTAHARTLVRTIVTLAHSMGIQVVAEGVETIDQLEFLRSVECDRGQGYLIARPMPADQLMRAMDPIAPGSDEEMRRRIAS